MEGSTLCLFYSWLLPVLHLYHFYHNLPIYANYADHPKIMKKTSQEDPTSLKDLLMLTQQEVR
jgi:hypothetical protein